MSTSIHCSVAKIGFDTAENDSSEVWWRILGYCLPAGGYWDTWILGLPNLKNQHWIRIDCGVGSRGIFSTTAEM